MSIFGAGHEVVTRTTRPASPTVGQIIFETDTLSYRWYNGTAWEGVTPVGTIQPFAGSTAPSGWLFCFGQTLNATSSPIYTDLYSALGTTYGGSSISAFNVPDLRGRVAAGKDNMGGTTASRITNAGAGIVGTTLGASGGTETHTLTQAQLAVHTHIQDAHGHSASSYIRVGGYDDYNFTGNGDWVTDSDAGERGTRPTYTTVNANTATNQNAGSGSAHLNTQPTIITNYIIKI